MEKEKLIHAFGLSEGDVTRKLSDHSWLTTDLIEEVCNSGEFPEREPGLGPFKDPDLASYLSIESSDGVFPPIAVGLTNFLTQRCTTSDGHFIPLNSITEVWDQKLAKYARELGFDLDSQFGVEIGREYAWELPKYVSLLCAPEKLKRDLIILQLNWGKENEGESVRKRTVLLLVAFIKKATDVYMARPKPKLRGRK
jgi:hypothetical protein